MQSNQGVVSFGRDYRRGINSNYFRYERNEIFGTDKTLSKRQRQQRRYVEIRLRERGEGEVGRRAGNITQIEKGGRRIL